MFRGMVVIQQGQTVRLVAQGEGFLASSEGKAMTRAAVGATLQVKTAAGRLVSGVARQDGQVSLAQ
jgi:flagella basal body P-ring formation protein FlgA